MNWAAFFALLFYALVGKMYEGLGGRDGTEDTGDVTGHALLAIHFTSKKMND